MIITLDVTDRELQALFSIIDAGVRQSGIRGAGDAVTWVMKLEEAMKIASRATGNGTGLSEGSLTEGT
jgi:hypothetical protein